MAYPTNSKSGSENLVALTLAIRAKCTTHDTNISSLTTDLDALELVVEQIKKDIAAKTEIDDTKATGTNVWSALKTSQEIAAAAKQAKNDLLNGAGEAYDTLKELGELIDTNKDAIAALQTIAAGHVKFDAAQSLTDAQKKQARDNISAAAASHTPTIAQVTNLQTTLDAKATKTYVDAELAKKVNTTDLGDPHVDLEAVFANGVTE